MRKWILDAARAWSRPMICTALAAGFLVPSSDLSRRTYPVATVSLRDHFGIDTSLYRPSTKQIRRSETLATILEDHGTAARLRRTAMERMLPLFEPRRLRAGAPIRIYRDIHTDSAHIFVYKPAPERYVVLDFRDSVAVYDGEFPVSVTRRSMHASITSSLYEAMADAGVDPNLALDLARIFAWQIDFYRIQHGARFSIVYDEHLVDGIVVNIQIVAAKFESDDREYYAFQYGQNASKGYYDEEGNTLKRTFLRAPLEYTRISSRYSLRRFHPVQRRFKAHLGTDYAAPSGTPIVATADGTVLEASYTSGNGRYVKIRHNNAYMTAYLHMSRIVSGIQRGSSVVQGEIIGYVGSTGLATGPHVCYRFWMHGKQVDPLLLDMPPAAPIAEAFRDEFFVLRDSLLPSLAQNP